MKKLIPTLVCSAVAALFPALASASCGAAFCTVNTNWTSETALADAGNAFDLRYEFINLNQPMSGTDTIAIGQIPHHHDEVRTLNRNVVATWSHSFVGGWGVSVSLPVSERDHIHVHNHHGAKLSENWNFTELGDTRVTGRYQKALLADPLKPALAGVTFGLKLPTGRTGVANDANSVAERSMQPGTGTTDAILGAFYHQKLTASDIAWFAQAQYQHALNTRSNYKPGSTFSADIGLRRGLTERLGGLLQLNAVRKGTDSGSEAEPEDSGQRTVALSPGLSYAIGAQTQVYAYYQHALYRKVNGVQLTADRAFVVGVSGQL
ncbi:transporter [Zemynaea arenosa]|nr:transporter [Massilia arenosa]